MVSSRRLGAFAAFSLALAACAPAAPGAAPTIAPAAATRPANTPAPATAGPPVRFTLAEGSEARYRVKEQLVNITLPNDAVGASKNLKGGVVVNPNGTADAAASKITIEMATLASDRNARDNFLRRNILHTEQFPTAEFTVKEVKGLGGSIPTTGSKEIEIAGDFTVRGVTKPVTWKATAQFTEKEVKGQATFAFTFGTFNIEIPRIAQFASVEDHIWLELDFVLTRN